MQLLQSRLAGCSHQLLLGTFRADDVISISDEPSSNQRCLASSTDETIIMPVAVFERDESGASDTCISNHFTHGDWKMRIKKGYELLCNGASTTEVANW
jgi:hypothetical protein